MVHLFQFLPGKPGVGRGILLSCVAQVGHEPPRGQLPDFICL
jgi:hypothetical protein